MKFKRIIKFLKKSAFIGLIIIIALGLLSLLVFSTVDYTPLKEKSYYKETISALDSLSIHSYASDPLQAGWAREHIIPQQAVNSAGYNRRGEIEGVHDSVFVSSVLINSGGQTTAIINYGLMIVHPILRDAVKEALADEVDHFYFTCTHTHSSFGGWAPGLAGYFSLGGYDEAIVSFLVEQTKKSVLKAASSLQPSSISFLKTNLRPLIGHRIDDHDRHTDPYLRVLKVKQEGGSTAFITVFSAHPTCLHRDDYHISDDYTGFLKKRLEKEKAIDFVMFCAGGVGSHKPIFDGKNDMLWDKGIQAKEDRNDPVIKEISYDVAKGYGEEVAIALLNDTNKFTLIQPKAIAFATLDVQLRAPHLRLSQNIRLRPWVFNTLIGQEINPQITCLKIGPITFAGTPADFSGELQKGIEQYIDSRHELIITSFNGEYMGYITHDRHYNSGSHEVMEMNWFGPYNGAYFTEIIGKMVNKLDKEINEDKL